ncbi:MAG TPA: LCP family protein, partial [Beutenbergiaceae bacterium]|nr:LCP family protein [Beutenbergiaceae bacterium]
MFFSSGIAWAYRDLDTNIETHSIDDLLGTERPEPPEPDPEDPHAGQALNVVLIGTDDRSGENRDLGGGTSPGVRSDTVIVAHISADRSRMEMISIPRDSWVTIPSCELPDGTQSYPQTGKFNGAFTIGGATGDLGYAAACTIRTIESLTDVRMDGFIAVDFAGFVNVVDALDGIPFCVPEPIQDSQAHIDLEAGDQILDGEQALGYARVRKSLGDGSDVQRIDRQQQLLAATVRHALNQNLLTDSPKLYRFLDAATSSVTASD